MPKKNGLLLCFTFIVLFTIQNISATDLVKMGNLALQRYGERAHNNVYDLQVMLTELKSAPEPEKLKRINEFFNTRIKYFDEDINIWGQTDYWATPLESLGKERGDCEDYSIAKYIFLRELEIPNDKLKLTYVRAQIGGPHSKIFQAHMVLSYYPSPSAEPLILDNLISEVRPASRRLDLSPVYSFNSEGLWLGNSSASRGDSSSHISRWRDLLLRIKSDGLD